MDIEPTIEQEAERYGVDARAYVDMTPKERGLVKAQWTRRVKAEAKRLCVDMEWWLSMTDAQRDVERERLLAEMAEKKRRAENGEEDDDDRDDGDGGDDGAPDSDGFKLYSDNGDVPATDAYPERRDGMTIGRIVEVDKPPDALGDERERHPRTLMDLYHRWPVGDGEHYIRVERTQPKQWQQVPCAGYLGDIREPLSEKKFQQFFGGREYQLTLYGPDPSGRTDSVTGLPRIKALTNPIKITVPVLPPNLAVLPAMMTNQESQQETQMTQPWNPFAPSAGVPTGVPTTPADAQVHKANVDLVSNVLKMTQEENRELRKARETEGSGASKQMLDFQRDILEQARRDAEAREKILREEIEAERREKEKHREEIEKVRQTMQQMTGRSDGTTLELVKTLGTSGAEREAQRAEFYRQQLEQVRAAHQDIVRAMEERQKGEIARADERLRTNDDYYKKLLDEERRKGEEREKHLKEEIERVRRDERDAAEARTRELKDRYDERLRDQEKAFERELRTVKENWETKMNTSLSTKEFEIVNLRERLEEAKEEATEARAKAEEANDPISVMEKAKKNAEALGYAKTEDAPKTAWERFAATAGTGFGQALQNIDRWLPEAAAALSGGRNAAQQAQVQGLAGGSPPQLTAAAAAARAAQTRPPVPARPRGVAWAAAGQPPTPPEQPETPLGFQPEQPEQPSPVAQPSGAPAPQQEAAQPATPSNGASQNQGATPPQQQQVQVENKLGIVFGDDAVMTFLGQLEMAINMGMEPDDFASRFVAGYRDAAMKMIEVYKPADVTGFVRTLPGADTSAILRRDGTKFLAGLWSEIQRQTAGPAAPAAAQSSVQPAS